MISKNFPYPPLVPATITIPEATVTTSLPRFPEPLLDKGVQVSMDGRGRALDNIFVERLWRSVKYKKVYLSDFETVKEAYLGLKDYFYNHRRFHQSLDYRTPAAVYLKKSGD